MVEVVQQEKLVTGLTYAGVVGQFSYPGWCQLGDLPPTHLTGLSVHSTLQPVLSNSESLAVSREDKLTPVKLLPSDLFPVLCMLVRHIHSLL